MESAALLSPTDINVIRRYVHTKYAPLPGDRRAEIVADAIRRTLQQRLPNIPAPIKSQIADELISRCLLSEQRDVKPEDVLDLCAELNYDEPNRRQQILEPILNWVNERSPGSWSMEQLTSRLERSNSLELALTTSLPMKVESLSRDRNTLKPLFGIRQLVRIFIVPSWRWVLLAAVVVSAVVVTIELDKPATPKPIVSINPPIVIRTPEIVPDIGMPERLKYTTIDVAALKKYLQSRDSLLAEAPYFEAIVNSARQYDIHPLLLFAITGQEQGFVPRTSKDAVQIANNPFNVFHSWEDYNTNINNSADIAAALIVKLAKKRPEGHEPFTWFNKTYAEDPLWSVGVRKIFDKLNSLPPSP